MPDAFLDADEIRASTFIRHVEIHDLLGSTNDRAAELARDAAIDVPALIAARRQTAGRGRGKNTWWSVDGALTFSVLLDPAALGIGTANWPQLSLAAAVAVCDAIAQEVDSAEERLNLQAASRNSQSQQRVAIKWPNDVMLDGGKACGILIESPGGSAPAKDRLIVGIGINVNNSCRLAHSAREASQTDKELAGATSLCDCTGRRHDLQRLLCETLSAFEARARQLSNGDPQLPAAWRQLCWLTEQRIEVRTNENWIGGTCTGIDSSGALLMENIFGNHRVTTGSVPVL
jgi:BirA family transcriptional regulator, biotin operon repressor / biotin---[acetyl-CoA-carboxylase] ligase